MRLAEIQSGRKTAEEEACPICMASNPGLEQLSSRRNRLRQPDTLTLLVFELSAHNAQNPCVRNALLSFKKLRVESLSDVRRVSLKVGNAG